jgi:hypothetical protein
MNGSFFAILQIIRKTVIASRRMAGSYKRVVDGTKGRPREGAASLEFIFPTTLSRQDLG